MDEWINNNIAPEYFNYIGLFIMTIIIGAFLTFIGLITNKVKDNEARTAEEQKEERITKRQKDFNTPRTQEEIPWWEESTSDKFWNFIEKHWWWMLILGFGSLIITMITS